VEIDSWLWLRPVFERSVAEPRALRYRPDG